MLLFSSSSSSSSSSSNKQILNIITYWTYLTFYSFKYEYATQTKWKNGTWLAIRKSTLTNQQQL